jgi:transposase
MPRPHDIHIRCTAIDRLYNVRGPDEIAQELEISRSSVFRYRNLFENTGSIAPTKRTTYKPHKIYSDLETYVRLRLSISTLPIAFQKEKAAFANVLCNNNNITRKDISRFQQREGLSQKKVNYVDPRRDENLCFDWFTHPPPYGVRGIDDFDSLVFDIDESGWNLFKADRRKGTSETGTRCYVERQAVSSSRL